MCMGFLFVVLGAIGAFVPIMPSIPFFIIASVCFSKSSQKFHNMLLNNKLIGPHIRNYHENKGIELKTKILFIFVQWAGIVGTAFFLVHNIFGRILMVLIGIGFSMYIISLKTAKSDKNANK